MFLGFKTYPANVQFTVNMNAVVDISLMNTNISLNTTTAKHIIHAENDSKASKLYMEIIEAIQNHVSFLDVSTLQ